LASGQRLKIDAELVRARLASPIGRAMVASPPAEAPAQHVVVAQPLPSNIDAQSLVSGCHATLPKHLAAKAMALKPHGELVQIVCEYATAFQVAHSENRVLKRKCDASDRMRTYYQDRYWVHADALADKERQLTMVAHMGRAGPAKRNFCVPGGLHLAGRGVMSNIAAHTMQLALHHDVSHQTVLRWKNKFRAVLDGEHDLGKELECLYRMES
jgi:hypothetical protein